MTDTTNEIICRCKHKLSSHDSKGCAIRTTSRTCGCELTREDILTAHLSALQTEVEGRGENVRAALIRLADAVTKDVSRNGGHGDVLGALSWAREVIVDTEPAATAPVEGETK